MVWMAGACGLTIGRAIVTTTVALARSVALNPLAQPVAVTVLVWVASRVIEQVYIQVSLVSSSALELLSPEARVTGLQLSSAIVILVTGTVPILWSVKV
jgi:hypothetical protein